MGKYRKYADNFIAMMEALRPKKAKENPIGVDMSPIPRKIYIENVLKDKYRATVVELRSPKHSAMETRHLIFNLEEYRNFPCYGPGDYDGVAFYFMITTNSYFREIYRAYRLDHNEDTNFQKYFGFPYIDDEGTPCGLAVYRFGHDPNANYVFSLIRNIHAPYDQREVTFICSEELIQLGHYTYLENQHHEEIIDEKDISDKLRSQIKSDRISDLLTQLFNNQEKITEENYTKLHARVRHYNLDNRDLLQPQITKILTRIDQLDPNIASPIKLYMQEDSIDFFEPTNYNKFLSYLVTSAQNHLPKNSELILFFRNIYLEYLVLQSYTGSLSESGLENDLINDLYDIFTKNIKYTKIDKNSFTEKANQFYRRIHFDRRLMILENAIQDSEYSATIKRKLNHITSRLRKAGDLFLDSSNAKQLTILNFIEELRTFIESPNDENYTTLAKRFPKVKLDPKDLESLRSAIEMENIQTQVSELKKNIAACKHGYIQAEIKQHIPFLKEKLAKELSLQDQIQIGQFLTYLNKLTKIETPTNDIITELDRFYTLLHLPSLSPEQKQLLLLPTHMITLHHHMTHDSYLFDTNGTILITEGNTSQNSKSITYSLDITNTQPKIAEKFTELLSKALQKQVTAYQTGKLLNLFTQNKAAIFPLQQSLYHYLYEIAKTYQAAMPPEFPLDEPNLQAAIMATLDHLTPTIITILAQGLVRSSNIGHFKEMIKLNKQELNRILKESQSDLYQQSKNIIIQQLRQKLHSQPATTPSAVKEEKNKIIMQTIYFDETQPFAWVTETQQPAPEYQCTEIKIYRSQMYTFSYDKRINHVRIKTNAFNFPEDTEERAYQTLFQQRLMTIEDTYQFGREHLPIVYNLYSASEEQIRQSIMAVHHYNRNKSQHQPLSLLQTWNLLGSGQEMGYPMEYSGNTSEVTLMHEMALCSQINSDFSMEGYERFLNPNSSLLSNLFSTNKFASSTEGRQMRQYIDELKTKWRQMQFPHDADKPYMVTSSAIQKMMAFNLHYRPEYALLMQALSLTNQGKSLLVENEELIEPVMDLGLGYAQIFDLLNLPDTLIEPFNMLLCATEKKTAVMAANLIKDYMHTYYLQHANGATILSVMQNAIKAGQNSTSERAVASTVQVLVEPPPTKASTMPSPRSLNGSPVKKMKNAMSKISTKGRSSSPAATTSPYGLFKQESEEGDNVLHSAAKEKAKAFRK